MEKTTRYSKNLNIIGLLPRVVKVVKINLNIWSCKRPRGGSLHGDYEEESEVKLGIYHVAPDERHCGVRGKSVPPRRGLWAAAVKAASGGR